MQIIKAKNVQIMAGHAEISLNNFLFKYAKVVRTDFDHMMHCLKFASALKKIALSTGRLFDERGNLKSWWTTKSTNAYKEREKCIKDQYSAYSLFGLNV